MSAVVKLEPFAVMLFPDNTVVLTVISVQVNPASKPKISPSCGPVRPRFVASIPPTKPPDEVVLVTSRVMGVMGLPGWLVQQSKELFWLPVRCS